MDILSGVISSPRILSREIYPNCSKTETSPTTPYVPVKTGSTSVVSPMTHRGLRDYLGECFPSPLDLYKYRSMNKE